MYGSTSACSVNVPSTSSLPHQQHSGGAAAPAMYYVSHLQTDPYGQQILQYGDAFAQDSVYPSKEIYTTSASKFARLPTYSYNGMPTNQNDFTSNVAPQFPTQPPPSLTNQNNSTATPQIIAQAHHNHQFNAGQRPVMPAQPHQPQIHSSPHPVNHQLFNLMHPPPHTYAKRVPDHQQYPINFSSNSVTSFPILNHQQQPTKIPNVHQVQAPNNGGSNNGHGFVAFVSGAEGAILDQRNTQLSTMFDNTADNYTASWVSSTSSIPAEQKIPPDRNSGHNSPTVFEFNNWNAELSKMSDNNQQQAVSNSNLGGSSNSIHPSMHAPHQPAHAYGAPPSQFNVPTSNHAAIPHVPYYQNQPQFPAHNVSFYPVPPSYYYPPQYVVPTGPVPGSIPNYVQNYSQPLVPAMMMHPVPFNPLWPPGTLPLEQQDEKFLGTWLDQNQFTSQEIEVQKDVIPHAIEHNSRQIGNNSGNNLRSGLLSSIAPPPQPQHHQNGNEPGYGDSSNNSVSYSNSNGNRSAFNNRGKERVGNRGSFRGGRQYHRAQPMQQVTQR